MSASELDTLTAIERVGEGRLTRAAASQQLEIIPRHLRRSVGSALAGASTAPTVT